MLVEEEPMRQVRRITTLALVLFVLLLPRIVARR